MRKSNQKEAPKIKGNPEIFKDKRVGRSGMKPLMHKDGTAYSDIEYFELLGRKALEMDKKNTSSVLPTNYGKYDRQTMEFAKEVVKAIDSGVPTEEIQTYINMSIDFEK